MSFSKVMVPTARPVSDAAVNVSGALSDADLQLITNKNKDSIYNVFIMN